MAQRVLDGTPCTVLDVGGGRESHIAQFCPKGSELIALDISSDELALNCEATQKVVADACQDIPLPPASVDLVTSYSVFEHLHDVTAFSRQAFRVLRPGGVMLHVFPCRYAIFAVINRVLPFKLSRQLISIFYDYFPKDYGFPAYYDQCSPGKIERALTQAGFKVETTVLDYYQSFWFTFFAPLYATSVLYELAVMALRLRPLCGHIAVLARKPSGQQE